MQPEFALSIWKTSPLQSGIQLTVGESALQNIEDEMENLGYLGIPTTTRPNEFRQPITTDHDAAETWMQANSRLLRPLVMES
ncbi:hypothetical protein Asppvi_008466 [Aspergillus pseudoviridinutans]|uniref:Uncharacterized protein n=1 Tax=Aspergillus pseudoviridinutans TaxID=1517512 RepID=A0A9P3BG40_9EURO|nr:uncharacterized protein Asppvi_008466 [Aspergillus pseudoviridinutans]GIJ89524.1 hypothetical protein Asppvi_008466 [Aspergillus pseudoviridinutans]